MKKSGQGFTLIEILTVVAIIVVLTALIVSAGSAVRTRSKTKATEAGIHILEDAIEQYVNDWHSYPLETFDVESGEATGGNSPPPAFTLEDSSKSWVANRWRGRRVYVIRGADPTVTHSAVILSNTATELTLEGLPFTVVSGDYYWIDVIYAGVSDADYEDADTVASINEALVFQLETDRKNGPYLPDSKYLVDADEDGYMEFIDAFSSSTSKGLPSSYKRPGNPYIPDSGTATGANPFPPPFTLEDSSKSWPDNYWQNTTAHVWDASDNNRKYSVEIGANDSDTLTFTSSPILFAGGDTYRLGVTIHNDPTCDIFSAGADGDYSTFDDNPANYNIGYGYDE